MPVLSPLLWVARPPVSFLLVVLLLAKENIPISGCYFQGGYAVTGIVVPPTLWATTYPVRNGTRRNPRCTSRQLETTKVRERIVRHPWLLQSAWLASAADGDDDNTKWKGSITSGPDSRGTYSLTFITQHPISEITFLPTIFGSQEAYREAIGGCPSKQHSRR